MYNSKIYISLFWLIASLLISACGDSTLEEPAPELQSQNSSEEMKSNNQERSFVGVFVDANRVEGLKYICDSKTSYTDKNGEFTCDTLPVRFYVGNIYLGAIEELDATYTIFTQSLLGVAIGATKNPLVTKLSTFIQSLDEDNTVENGVKITRKIDALINEKISSPKAYLKIDENELTVLSRYIEERKLSSSESARSIKRSKLDIQDNLTLAITKSYKPKQP